MHDISVQLLGVHACVTTFQQTRYLFSEKAEIAGRWVYSDSGQMARNLVGPYWFWGGLLSVASLSILVLGLQLAHSA